MSGETVCCLFLTRLLHFAFTTPEFLQVVARGEISFLFKADKVPLNGGTAFCSPGGSHPSGSRG